MAAETPRSKGISLKRTIWQAMLAYGIGPKHLTEVQRAAMEDTGLTVARQEMRVVEVHVRT